LWMLEVANTLCMLVRRGKLHRTRRVEACDALMLLKPSIDEEAAAYAFGRLTELAENYQLTVYDASYLELALRRGLPLASRDTALNKAAKRCGVKTLL
ncbi:MAG: type II toxin-antitoxin system VapC family toxin, partial [Acidobacteriota bacterium]